jgi:hypothetical protein
MGDRLRRRIPAAVVVSKADTLWTQKEWEPFQNNTPATRAEIDALVQRLLEESGRGAILQACRGLFSFVSYFAISAYGRRVYKYPTSFDSLRPTRVEEPLIALIRGEVQAENG